MTTNNYGLTSLTEDMAAIGLRVGGSTQAAQGAPAATRAPAALLQMESTLASQFGGRGRSRVLSTLNALAEGRSAPARGTPAQRPAARRNMGRVQESLQAFSARVSRPATVSNNVRAAARTPAIARLAEEVHGLVGELREVNTAEAVRGWANVSTISEMLSRRLTVIGQRLRVPGITNAGRQLGELANKSAKITMTLREKRTTAAIPQIAEKFSQASAYVIAGTQLYAGLTEGPDAPFPLPAAPTQGQPPMGQPPMPTEGDPMGMGASMPTQGVEGADPMGGELPDPLGLGAPAGGMPPKPGMPGMPPQGEGMDDDDRVPFFQGAEDPDLDHDPMGEGDDPLGLGQGGATDPLGQG